MSSNPPETATVPGPSTGRPSGPRNVRRTILIIGLVIALVAVGSVAATEAYFRHKTQNCIATQVEQSLGSNVSVGLGPRPVLLTGLDHRLQSVNIDSDDAKFGPATDMKVHVQLDDIRMKDDGGADVGSSSAHATWSDQGIAETLGGLVSEVRSNPGAGTLDAKVLGGLAGLQVKPHIVGDKIEVSTQSAQLFGMGLPTDLVDGIVQTMTESLQTYPLDMKPTEVKVTDQGIEVALTGGATTLQAGQNGEAPKC